MKKFFLSALLAVSVVGVRAQSIAAGTVSLGGSIGYSSNTEKSDYKSNNTTYSNEYTHSQFQFSPSFGYFVADNLAIGLSLGYGRRKPRTKPRPRGRAAAPTCLSGSMPALRCAWGWGLRAVTTRCSASSSAILGTFGVGYQNSFTPNYMNNNPSRIVESKTSGF